MARKTIATDFDGTIHPYTKGWTGPVPEDEPPIEGTQEFFETLKEFGYDIVIFSTRAETEEGREGIFDWLVKYGLIEYISQVTDVKIPALAYVDDRGVSFQGDWEEVLDGIARLAAQE